MVDTHSDAPVRERASAATDQAVEAGRDVKDAATQQIGDLAGQAKDQARNVMDEARGELRRQADDQAHRLSGTVHQASEQLRSMADSTQPGTVADVTRQVGTTLGRLADTMERDGIQGIADDVRSFARRQPGVFLAGAALAGFCVARLLRSGAMSSANGGASSGVSDAVGRGSPGAVPMAGASPPIEAPVLPAGDGMEGTITPPAP
jgi:hypothetical protein